MIKLSVLIPYLRAKLLREKGLPTVSQPVTPSQHIKVSSSKTHRATSAPSSTRGPYFVQIGFDFGTMYSKCVCRDVMTNKAWVHLSSGSEEEEFPFLIPSILLLRDGKIEHAQDPACHYPENGLYHLKLALEKVALCRWEDPLLHLYRNAVGSETEELTRFVTSCAVFFLAGALGEVKNQVRRRLPAFGSHKQDYMAVNMAIPVADAERSAVSNLYNQILNEAWSLADQLAGHPPINLIELEMLRNNDAALQVQSASEACFIYPEVSANVQGFVRSRVSSPGIYIFSDAGAGSVDQSVFIFLREGHHERLNYLHGNVLPLGSSKIERHAAEGASRTDSQSLESWRIKKERGERDPDLDRARTWIIQQLSLGTETTLGYAKRKLHVRDQLCQTQVIFGGGGHSKHPYEGGVIRPFSGQLFPRPIRPDIVGLPVPTDLERPFRSDWFKRLSVAYGLSFTRDELAPFTYPQNISTPSPQEIWQPRAALGHAPTQDEC